mmetsp:Transcript_155361/g.498472  ORF Transcript_155361/g.498472 Transcript_155361/m.498472 type:complete len:242 (-) Transcript_155361:3163-3888(-)
MLALATAATNVSRGKVPNRAVSASLHDCKTASRAPCNTLSKSLVTSGPSAGEDAPPMRLACTFGFLVRCWTSCTNALTFTRCDATMGLPDKDALLAARGATAILNASASMVQRSVLISGKWRGASVRKEAIGTVPSDAALAINGPNRSGDVRVASAESHKAPSIKNKRRRCNARKNRSQGIEPTFSGSRASIKADRLSSGIAKPATHRATTFKSSAKIASCPNKRGACFASRTPTKPVHPN